MEQIVVELKDYFERVLTERNTFYMGMMNERDVLYKEMFKSEVAARNNLYAHAVELITKNADAVTTAFAASEKAITKAENAQSEYNVRSNEFRGQLDDQAKLLIPRQEVVALLRAYDDKIAVLVGNIDRRFDDIRTDVIALREAKSEGSGRLSAETAEGMQRNWLVALIVSAVLGALGIFIAYSHH
jgi:hypothetical protein